ncbi:unnamed protein product [Amoebophrya sp. A25]|nr:unnamed protein product [Amoebophrya sp. A25]|eukprot:GSA25T00010139001.1
MKKMALLLRCVSRLLVLTAVVSTSATGQAPSSTPSAAETDAASTSLWSSCLKSHYPDSREDFAYLLNCLGLTGEAAEIGVQRGLHAKQFLEKWKGKKLFLVDRWTHVPSDTYIDIANIPSDGMQQLKSEMERNLEVFSSRYAVLEAWSEDAAKKVPDGSLDFVYLDARHDFQGVYADLSSWWPKLKIGGLIAGHDFCDGELPEGDFFVETAVRSFLALNQEEAEGEEKSVVVGETQHESTTSSGTTGTAEVEVDDKLNKQFPVVHVTREQTKYLSFFVLKTAELDTRVRASAFRSIAFHHVYPRFSWYFALFHRDQEHFLPKCKTLCTFDCDRRLRRIFPEEYNTSSSDDRLASIFTAGNGETAKVEEKSTAATSTSPSSQLSQGYGTECERRCSVTCGQRQSLFTKIQATRRKGAIATLGGKEEAHVEVDEFAHVDEEQFKVDAALLDDWSDPVPHEKEFVLNLDNFPQVGTSTAPGRSASTSSKDDSAISKSGTSRTATSDIIPAAAGAAGRPSSHTTSSVRRREEDTSKLHHVICGSVHGAKHHAFNFFKWGVPSEKSASLLPDESTSTDTTRKTPYIDREL